MKTTAAATATATTLLSARRFVFHTFAQNARSVHLLLQTLATIPSPSLFQKNRAGQLCFPPLSGASPDPSMRAAAQKQRDSAERGAAATTAPTTAPKAPLPATATDIESQSPYQKT